MRGPRRKAPGARSLHSDTMDVSNIRKACGSSPSEKRVVRGSRFALLSFPRVRFAWRARGRPSPRAAADERNPGIRDPPPRGAESARRGLIKKLATREMTERNALFMWTRQKLALLKKMTNSRVASLQMPDSMVEPSILNVALRHTYSSAGPVRQPPCANANSRFATANTSQNGALVGQSSVCHVLFARLRTFSHFSIRPVLSTFHILNKY
jgi:hypothetical protein